VRGVTFTEGCAKDSRQTADQLFFLPLVDV